MHFFDSPVVPLRIDGTRAFGGVVQDGVHLLPFSELASSVQVLNWGLVELLRGCGLLLAWKLRVVGRTAL